MIMKQVTRTLLAAALLATPLSAQDDKYFTQDTERRVPTSQMQVKLSYAPLVKSASPAVVNIYTRKVEKVRRSSWLERFFGDRGNHGVPEERVTGSLGSGVIVRANGIIITNNHVIKGADEITVVLSDRREFDAEVVMADAGTDLAVLRIQVGDDVLPIVKMADSDHVEVGDIVLAIGNPFGVGQSVTGGIVSATARTQQGISDFGFFIQTDASINPGNSGGALIGIDGELIGINTAIYSRTGASNGIGFAVPTNMVQVVLRAALTDGTLVRPWIGIDGQNVTSDLAEGLGLDRAGGVIIGSLYPDGPAERGGLNVGDVILGINDFDVIDQGGLNFRTATREEGEMVEVVVLRGDELQTYQLSLELPPENPARNVTLIDGRHPFQGVTVANLSPRFNDENRINVLRKGVMVTKLSGNSAAARARFVMPGDVLLELNSQPITTVQTFVNALDSITASQEAVDEDEREPATYLFRLERRGEVRECAIRGNSLRCGTSR